MKLPGWQTLVMIGMAAYILYLQECKVGGDCPEITASDTTYIKGDSVFTEIEVDRPYPVWRERVIPGRIDTVEIIRDYFTKYYYVDTIAQDSNFIAVIMDTLYNNKIISRKFFHQNLRQTAVIINNELENKPRLKIFAGGMAGGSMVKFGAGGGLVLLSKRDNLYGFHYDAINRMSYGSIYFKIRLKKPRLIP